MLAQMSDRWRWRLWVIWVVLALVSLEFLNLTVYGVVIPLSGLALAAIIGPKPLQTVSTDTRDVLAVALLYLAVVALFRVAFTVFGTGNVAGLFLTFAAGMLVGFGGPLVYTVWLRRRPLSDLGLRLDNWRTTAVLAVCFAAVQYALTLFGYSYPAAQDWVPLLVMSLTVGAFEAVFFRGFVQTRLCASFGTVPGITGAAALYGLYHVGYGMGGAEMVFLFGLGVVYAAAFALVRNVLVLWPLLTPLGAFFNNLNSGDISLPWASIAGFADVLAVMGVLVWLAARHQRRLSSSQARAHVPSR
jgi:membrane protease YdiL (CAAX protease family)